MGFEGRAPGRGRGGPVVRCCGHCAEEEGEAVGGVESYLVGSVRRLGVNRGYLIGVMRMLGGRDKQ